MFPIISFADVRQTVPWCRGNYANALSKFALAVLRELKTLEPMIVAPFLVFPLSYPVSNWD